MLNKGLIHIYCGDGKGKTTASVGLAIRAFGRGYRVVFLQFLKWQPTGEIEVLKHLEHLTVVRGEGLPHKFTWSMNEEEKQQLIQCHNALFQKGISYCKGEKCLFIMDELVGTFDMNLIDQKMVLDYLQHKPDFVEVVMTGRNPAPELIDLADYVSEIRKVKHPMDQGILAREGIEL